jgi:hypothetical protein
MGTIDQQQSAELWHLERELLKLCARLLSTSPLRLSGPAALSELHPVGSLWILVLLSNRCSRSMLFKLVISGKVGSGADVPAALIH